MIKTLKIMKKSTKLLLEIAKQIPGMGTFEFNGEDEKQFIWDMFHINLTRMSQIISIFAA